MRIRSVKEWNGNGRPLIIAGPCAAESREQLSSTAQAIASIDKNIIFRAGIWKPRTRPGSFQGIGGEALPWLKEIEEKIGLRVCTEVANREQVEACLAAGITTLWVGARTTVNPFYVEEIAQAVKGKNVRILIKNPIHPDLNAWIGSIERFYQAGIEYLVAIHRGFHPLPASKYRNYPNWAIPIELKHHYPDLPIITDPSHITGNRQMIEKVCQDAMDMHMDGLMIETHINPELALSDKEQQITPAELQQILLHLEIHRDSTLPPQNLENLRLEIDQIDYQLLKLLKKRMDCAKQIGKIKMDNDLALFQPERWNKLLAERQLWAEELGIRDAFTSDLFKTIHAESIALQKKLWRE